ncbi:hypothetical protein PCC7424_4847 [Gloeothece citriformis PCC 7424]|uniref:Uncharacterized protein n=1 Tax=Gloeothece citriformis (strain PCC 7424) TaxID=65393 RepID=B7KE86_GLOC7|nr:hypothetical protein PCC7424_4847 [Gloeothece citriformis PCC 7424]
MIIHSQKTFIIIITNYPNQKTPHYQLSIINCPL